MVRYLLDFKTIHDVAVRTIIFTLAIALLSAVATEQSYKLFFPDMYSIIGGKPFLVAFSLAILLGMPIIGVFFSAGLEINRLNTRLESLAQEDPLTGLMNRRKFFEAVSTTRSSDSQELVMRNRGALLIVDADFFKRINDDHGHQAGDEALIFIAEAMRKTVRDDDAVGRLGGEEFGVFLHETDQGTAFEVAERIRSSICAMPIEIMGQKISLSVSIGGTQALRSQTLSDCMRNADILLYASKQSGRNKTLFAGPAGIAPFVDVLAVDRRTRINARA